VPVFSVLDVGVILVDSIPGSIATLTASGELESVNRRSLEYFGKSIDELKNWATNDVIHPDDLRDVIEAFKRGVASGEPFEYDNRSRRSDGICRWHHGRFHPQRDEAGQIVRW